ncbi:hypothetical protein FOCC_FOCC015788 [Frankliniella occidentalis]|nr:hypothetical protein FOCC_FOCC015788 [Frankliniella occidentalis]
MAERHVQTIKKTVKKAIAAGRDPHQCVLEVCNTPIINDLSPAQILMGRCLRGKLPLTLQRQSKQVNYDEISKVLKSRQAKQKSYYDRNAAPRTPLQPGPAYTRVEGPKSQWEPVTVLKKSSRPRSYTVQLPSGNTVDRTRMHLHQPPIKGEKQPLITSRKFTSVLYLQSPAEEEVRQVVAGAGPSVTPVRTPTSPPRMHTEHAPRTSPQRPPSSVTSEDTSSLMSSSGNSPRSRPGRGRARRSLDAQQTSRFGRPIVKPGHLQDFILDEPSSSCCEY